MFLVCFFSRNFQVRRTVLINKTFTRSIGHGPASGVPATLEVPILCSTSAASHIPPYPQPCLPCKVPL